MPADTFQSRPAGNRTASQEGPSAGAGRLLLDAPWGRTPGFGWLRLSFRRPHGEQHRHLRTEAEILRPLAHVELERRLALAGLARLQPQQEVLERLAAQPLAQGRLHHGRLQPLVGSGLAVAANLRSRHRHRPGDARLVDDLHQHGHLLPLAQLRSRRAADRLHPALGVDGDGKQAIGIEQLLHVGAEVLGVLVVVAQESLEGALGVRRKRRLQLLECLEQPVTVVAEPGSVHLAGHGERGLRGGDRCQDKKQASRDCDRHAHDRLP